MLTKSEQQFIHTLTGSSFGNAERLHEAGVKAVKKAYGDAEDKGELGQAICNAVRVGERIELARFMRKHGLGVEINKTQVVIGGPRDAKRQAKDINAAKNDIAFFRLVDAHVKPKATPKVKEGAVADLAKEAIASLIDRVKKSESYGEKAGLVAAEINDRLSQKVVKIETQVAPASTLITKDGRQFRLDAEEEEALVAFLLQREVVKLNLDAPVSFEHLISEEARRLAA